MADPKHLGHMVPDILKGNVFKLTAAFRALGSIYFQIHLFAIGTCAGQGPVGHQMGFDFIKIKFLIDPDKSFRHKMYYIKKPAESSILFFI